MTAVQAEALDDLRAALAPFVHDRFPMQWNPTIDREEDPIQGPAVVVRLRRFNHSIFPSDAMQLLEKLAYAAQTNMVRTFPSVPVTVEMLRPPIHECHGFVVRLDTPPREPAYPSFVIGHARLYATNAYRRLLGLPEKDEA